MDDQWPVKHLSELLSQGLDLCVRARKLDDSIKQRVSGESLSRSATPALWVMDQYDTDLAKWEADARAALLELGAIKNA